MPVSNEDLAQLAGKYAEYKLAKQSYSEYFMMAHDYRFKLYPHTKLLCDKLQEILDGKQKFLIISMPPQHGKSTTISETFPSDYLMHFPDKEVMIASYSDDLAQKFGRFNLQKFQRFAKPMFGLNVSGSKHTSNEWQIEGHKGAMHASTILGSATGKHADLLIIDDPIKGMQDASSATIRNKIWNEWQASFLSRRSADASIIVIMTRWHVDDLAGRLLKQNAFPWEEIKLPALAEDDDPLGRKPGTPLCPFPPMSKGKEWAEQTKKSIANNVWAALYQQRPVLDGGNIFKAQNINYYVPDVATLNRLGLQNDNNVVVKPQMEKVWSSWDLTFTASDTSDYTAGQTWGKNGANFYLLDRTHARLEFTKQIKEILKMHSRHPDANATYIEDKANGSAVMNVLRSQLSGVIPVIPKGDKVTRANVVVPFFESGNVYLPHPLWQPWVNEMLDEWTGFPNMEHDDEVDSMTQALSREVTNQRASVMIYGQDPIPGLGYLNY